MPHGARQPRAAHKFKRASAPSVICRLSIPPPRSSSREAQPVVTLITLYNPARQRRAISETALAIAVVARYLAVVQSLNTGHKAMTRILPRLKPRMSPRSRLLACNAE